MSVLTLLREDCLYRLPSLPSPPACSLVLSYRHPSGVPLEVGWRLLLFLGDGQLPFFQRAAGGLQFCTFLPPPAAASVLVSLGRRWLPTLLLKDLPVVLRPFQGVVVVADWGELNLPVSEECFGRRLAVHCQLQPPLPFFFSFFALHPKSP